MRLDDPPGPSDGTVKEKGERYRPRHCSISDSRQRRRQCDGALRPQGGILAATEPH